jgi:hypothetical protein
MDLYNHHYSPIAYFTKFKIDPLDQVCWDCQQAELGAVQKYGYGYESYCTCEPNAPPPLGRYQYVDLRVVGAPAPAPRACKFNVRVFQVTGVQYGQANIYLMNEDHLVEEFVIDSTEELRTNLA